MRISDEERHGIARKLRELPARAVYDMAITLHCLIWPPNITYTGIDQLFARLADLIDRPTCDVRMGVTGHVGVCTRCGAMVEMRAAVFDAIEALPTRYCPNCGAEVVPDVE